jgi:hypothetical protein
MLVTLEPSDGWRIAANASWAVAAPYLWLIVAYVVAALRTQSSFWGHRALVWGQGLILLFVFRLFVGEQFFEPYTNANWRDFYLVFGAALVALTAVPLYRIVRHFTDSIPGDGYWNARDVLLFKAPIHELQGQAAAKLWARYVLICVVGLVIAAAINWSAVYLKIGYAVPVFFGVTLLFAVGSVIYHFKGFGSPAKAAPPNSRANVSPGSRNAPKRSKQRTSKPAK